MSETFWDRHGMYGVMAQFETPEQLLEAAQPAYARGLSQYGRLYAHARSMAWPKRSASAATGYRSSF